MNQPEGAARRPYVRPMAGWWRRDPFFLRYMVREATALVVALYAIVLLVGVLRLSQGEAAWNAWLNALRSPWSVGCHLLMGLAMIYHAVSWFQIMPKTLPMLFAGGQRIAQQTITRAGWAAAVLVSAGLFLLTWIWAP